MGRTNKVRPTSISEPWSRLEAVDEGLQEGNDVVFFLGCQAKFADSRVFVVGIFSGSGQQVTFSTVPFGQ